jgi:hypothetical protein
MARRNSLDRLNDLTQRGRPVTGRLVLQALQEHDTAGGAFTLTGARITGGLDLRGRVHDFAVELTHCRIDGTVCLADAVARSVDLTGSVLDEIDAERVEVTGDLRLTRTRVGTVTQATMTGPAVRPDSRGDVTAGPSRLLEETVHSPVRLADARIGGNLRLDAMRVLNAVSWPVLAPRLSVGADLQARRLDLEGGLYLRNARVTQAIHLDGARLAGLDASGITCGRGFYADWGFRSTGSVLLRGAAVESIVTFHGAELSGSESGLILSRLRTERLRLDMAVPPPGPVILRDARVGSMVDSMGSWPGPGLLDLEGFSYSRLGSDATLAARDRVNWLTLDQSVSGRSFEQLAVSYEQAGDDRSARVVRHARERRRSRGEGLTGRLWGSLQDLLFGYGYAPRRALGWLLLLVGGGSLWFARHRPPVLSGGGHPEWNPVLYCVDLLVPLAGLGYRTAYAPVGAGQVVAFLLTGAGWLLATTIIAGARRVLGRG